MPLFLDRYFMKLDVTQSRDAYGQLLEGYPEIGRGSGDFRITAGGRYIPGDGLWVLEIQDRIYDFLLIMIKKILHDIKFDSLCDPQYPVRPEPPLVSANGKGIITLAITNLEAAYLPTAQLDLTRVLSVIEARLGQAEDKVASLREDPGYFSSSLLEFIGHRYEYMLHMDGTPNPLVGKNGINMMLRGMNKAFHRSGIDEYDDLVTDYFIRHTLQDLEIWAGLRAKVAQVIELKSQTFDGKDIKPTDALPRDLALAFYMLYAELCEEVEARVVLLRTEVYSSAPIRPYYRRASSDPFDGKFAVWKKPPAEISQVMLLFETLQDTYLQTSYGHIAEVQAVMEEFEQLPSEVARTAISPRLAEHVSSLAIVSECLRQVQLFQPWAATFESEMEDESNKPTVRKAMTPKPCPYLRKNIVKMAQALKNIPYPADKGRNRENVDTMRRAEAALDKFWEAVFAEKFKYPLPANSGRILRELRPQRTPEWVEPTKATKKILGEEPRRLAMPLGEIHTNGRSVMSINQPAKQKMKTRGTGNPQAQPAETKLPQEPSAQMSDTAAPTIKVDKRSLRVFRTFFHTPSAASHPGEVSWADFLHAMQSAGCLAEKLYGSVWQFTAAAAASSARRSILFHEPHPSPKISFWKAREHGRRLRRAYGWSGETFALE
jgi:hypothetical protein